MLVPLTLKDSTSWAELNPLVIDAVALLRLALSGSATVIVAVTWVAGAFSVYARVEVWMPASTGGSFTAVMLIVRACVLEAWLADWPSSTWNVTTRLVVVGLSLLLKYLTDRSTVW